MQNACNELLPFIASSLVPINVTPLNSVVKALGESSKALKPLIVPPLNVHALTANTPTLFVEDIVQPVKIDLLLLSTAGPCTAAADVLLIITWFILQFSPISKPTPAPPNISPPFTVIFCVLPVFKSKVPLILPPDNSTVPPLQVLI